MTSPTQYPSLSFPPTYSFKANFLPLLSHLEILSSSTQIIACLPKVPVQKFFEFTDTSNPIIIPFFQYPSPTPSPHRLLPSFFTQLPGPTLRYSLANNSLGHLTFCSTHLQDSIVLKLHKQITVARGKYLTNMLTGPLKTINTGAAPPRSDLRLRLRGGKGQRPGPGFLRLPTEG